MTQKCQHCRTKYQPIRRSSQFCSTRCRMAAHRKRRKRSVHFRSDSPEWSTPQDLFDKLDAEFRFETDVCATAENAKCEQFYTRADNGLEQPWTGVCWMNPPYGAEIGAWVAKAHQSAMHGATVVCLVPARTDTKWWHDHVTKAKDVRFLRGRLKFGGCKNSAPFPSAVVVS